MDLSYRKEKRSESYMMILLSDYQHILTQTSLHGKSKNCLSCRKMRFSYCNNFTYKQTVFLTSFSKANVTQNALYLRSLTKFSFNLTCRSYFHTESQSAGNKLRPLNSILNQDIQVALCGFNHNELE